MSSSTVNTMLASLINTVTDVLVTNIPLVLAIVGGLIALSFIVRYVKQHLVGGRR